MHVLLVEDDASIGKSIRKGLEETGWTCLWATTAAQAEEKLAREPFDVLVLDVMLPDKSGLDLLAQLRSQGNRTPVLMLTALGTVEDRVRGLRDGADDYLVKPFAFPELIARVEALARRRTDRPSPTTTVGGLSLDLTTRRVSMKDIVIDLTPTEFSLLEFLMRHFEQVVTRQMLCEHLWDPGWVGETNVIEVHINRLRGKLERVGAEGMVQTVRGRGYVLRAA